MDTELTQICAYALRSVQHAWLPYRPGPGPDAPLIALLTALDTMCAVHAVFFHRYALLSAAERWVGGRGVVQFATIANTQNRCASTATFIPAGPLPRALRRLPRICQVHRP